MGRSVFLLRNHKKLSQNFQSNINDFKKIKKRDSSFTKLEKYPVEIEASDVQTEFLFSYPESSSINSTVQNVFLF